jgi:hypothetical protein
MKEQGSLAEWIPVEDAAITSKYNALFQATVAQVIDRELTNSIFLVTDPDKTETLTLKSFAASEVAESEDQLAEVVIRLAHRFVGAYTFMVDNERTEEVLATDWKDVAIEAYALRKGRYGVILTAFMAAVPFDTWLNEQANLTSGNPSGNRMPRLRPLTVEDATTLKNLLGTGDHNITVNYLGKIATFRNKGTDTIPAEFLLDAIDGEDWPL